MLMEKVITMEERCSSIIEECISSTEMNPVMLFNKLANKEYVRIHGPEHHILDGACVLTAFYNAGGSLDLRKSLEKLMAEGMRMPGATCGLWGVCGSVASVGAALAIIEETGPLTENDSFGLHMECTSRALKEISKLGGPRCCKRHAFIAMKEAVTYLNERFSMKIPYGEIKCGYSSKNMQCIKNRCPFYAGGQA